MTIKKPHKNICNKFNQTVFNMLEEKLSELGADGLFNPDLDCGCLIDDLMDCNCNGGGCIAAKNNKKKAKSEGIKFRMEPLYYKKLKR